MSQSAQKYLCENQRYLRENIFPFKFYRLYELMYLFKSSMDDSKLKASFTLK